MTPFFYSDPLAAAWQAKHFSMVFQGSSFSVEWRSQVVDFPRGVATIKESIVAPVDEPYCFYVHPDSLHLLQPQVGDWFAYHHTGMERAQIFGPLEAEFIKGALSEFVPGRFIGEVIKRNGMPFIWPESEAA